MPRGNVSEITVKAADVPIIIGMITRGDRYQNIAAWFGLNPGRMSGSTCAHSSSFRSLRYRKSSRLYFARFSFVHIAPRISPPSLITTDSRTQQLSDQTLSNTICARQTCFCGAFRSLTTARSRSRSAGRTETVMPVRMPQTRTPRVAGNPSRDSNVRFDPLALTVIGVARDLD